MPQHRTNLVTGGAGFIGSHLVEHLLARGDRVVVIDDLSTGRREKLAACDGAIADGRLTVIEGRLLDVLGRDGGAVSRGRRFDAIYHLAAAVGVRLVVERPIHTIETNVLETCALLRFAQQHGAPTFIASTSEVYGKATKMPFSEDDDVVYGSTAHSRWSYACSKAIDEYLALAWRREHDLPVVIGRLFNTVGPRQRGEYGMVLPRFVAAAANGMPIEVHGDGKQSRCFCDVRDVVPAIVALVGRLESRGAMQDFPVPCFNIGSDQPITIQSLARLVQETLRSDGPIVNVPYDKAYGEGFDDLRARQPDLTRIRAAIAFAPTIPLEQTIRDVAAEMKRSGEPCGSSSNEVCREDAEDAEGRGRGNVESRNERIQEEATRSSSVDSQSPRSRHGGSTTRRPSR